MPLILWIVLGGVAGWIGSLIMGTDGSQGIIGNIVVGIIGAVIGGFIFNFFGETGVSGFNFYSLFVSVVGALVTIWLYKAIRN
jgi:uncharacterized membrane protein YeaQ/YmgE (transglycosylase-associated protein family)